jgi:hypothetical protein
MEYLLIAGGCAAAAYGFGYFLMRRVQAHLLEYFITLVASTIPMGILLSAFRRSMMMMFGKLEVCTIIALLPVCLVIGGSVWGISIANRLRMINTAKRIGMIGLGWGFLLSLCVFGFQICSVLYEPIRPGTLIVFPGFVFFAVSVWCYERQAAPFAPLPGSDQVTRLPRL